ncbi:MAG: TIGR00282 family metallophosphoesterase [Bacilli bacterium]|nr:TIGR00282 family metallophosphoesterase [Bacilli bacterium]MDD4076516.1 TIGR00282 family metallophosphoesterase [Bacilli bacterium]MDD4387727.1 TIGR00282 family metallophosphoesterase [Bacilli bacterium]
MKILIVGDVYSKLGRASFERNVKQIKEKEKIDIIIVNGENTSHGRGLNEKHYRWYLNQGVSIITLGNHAFENKSIIDFINDTDNVIRPYNFPNKFPGKGFITFRWNNLKITVMQMIGKVFMNDEYLCPFEKTLDLLNKLDSDIYICDFHAEATSEKIAYAHCFDGKIHVIYGTHTHVQTNDARIMENGTAYITDVGMTGALDGVIGVKKEIIINRFLYGMQERFTPQNEGKTQFNAIILEINEISKKAANIDIINLIE